MKELERELQNLNASSNDHLVHHVLDLLKEGHGITKKNSSAGLPDVEICEGNSTFKITHNKDKSLSVAQIKDLEEVAFEKFVGKKLAEKKLTRDVHLDGGVTVPETIDFKMNPNTGSLLEKIHTGKDYTEKVAYSLRTGKPIQSVCTSEGDDPTQSITRMDPVDGHVTSQCIVEPQFSAGNGVFGRMTFTQFDKAADTVTEEMIFGDGRHHLTFTEHLHSIRAEKSTVRDWTSPAQPIQFKSN
ncbi:MAG TPA: hypothetical protein V6C76_12995 [Drouetiella sp.]